MDLTFIVEVVVLAVEILVIALVLVHFHRLERNTEAVNRIIKRLDDHINELDHDYERIEKCVYRLCEAESKIYDYLRKQRKTSQRD
ncbi:MAG: hypothetical protein ACP5PX_00080 [Candidatus Hadarchaeum sp.]|uniref:hypothetical protein n=1 Tax=Candidatus Hadarchaeum sp. TaxID=2883567 RepID=UPI003D0E9EB7